MKIEQLGYALGCAAALGSTWSLAVPRDAAYETPVQLSSGKKLLCSVNQPQPAGAAAVLTRREQVEADVLATQRLRLVSGPFSPYPSEYTAPSVACISVN